MIKIKYILTQLILIISKIFPDSREICDQLYSYVSLLDE